MINTDGIMTPLYYREHEPTGLRIYDVEEMVDYFRNHLKILNRQVADLEIHWDYRDSMNDKYLFHDRDDDFDGGYADDEALIDFLSDWNEQMETNYQSIDDFNEGEEYYTIVRNPEWKEQ